MKHPYFYTDGLSVGYGGVPLLKDIALRFERGQIVSLIGPNGAGKTTLLKSVIRQLEPVSGGVYLDGRDVKKLPLDQLARQVSVLLTERVRPELMTCRDVVATGRYPYTGTFGVLGPEDHAKLQEAMDQVQISGLADRYFSQCSDGQKQRVMLARALCQEPHLLVLDEPTSYLDLRYKLQLLTLLQDLSRTRKLSVLLSLHEVDLAAKVSHRVACVRGDRIERFGPPDKVLTPGYLQDLYHMDAGTYDDRTGSLELEPVSGPPRLFVLAGAGTGALLFRRLQRAGVPFAAGVLWENDLDYPVASALAGQVISVPAFAPIEEIHLQQARALMDACDGTLCALPPRQMTGQAAPLGQLLDYARSQGKLRDPHATLSEERRTHEL